MFATSILAVDLDVVTVVTFSQALHGTSRAVLLFEMYDSFRGS
jgi:hypothetical protein